jgi:hypothetical protein
MKDTNQEENADSRKDCIRRRKCLKKQTLKQKFSASKHPNIHQANTPSKGGGKRIQDIYGRGDTFCETIVTTLGLAERGDLLSKDGEDGLGGFAGLKIEKERVRG